MTGVPEFEVRGRSTDLIVLLHAYVSSPDNLAYIRTVAASERPDADILVPAMPTALFSLADPIDIARELLEKVDHAWTERAENGEPYSRIVLVGHSLGALIARKVYVFACGENDDAPFESDRPSPSLRMTKESRAVPRNWASRVERIVLLAAMNRGWVISHHMSFSRAAAWTIGTFVGNTITFVARRPPLIFTFRRGAPFLTELRIQWLSMREHARRKRVGDALTVQLLGSIDDMVSPEDNLDLVAGHDFVYLDVPHSGHANVVEMDDTSAGRGRAEVLRRALTRGEGELEAEKVRPSDLPLPARREEVTDVIFVIHGIRDLGYWTHKIARRVQALGKAAHRVFESETSSYGYFPMLSFLLPGRRRAKVEWLMDQYAEAKALYPNAKFSFVGHSNGTYLVARALRDYPCCRFHRVVFAGSVVSTGYDWCTLLQNGRVGAVMNYVATADWVVAIFPKAVQMLRLQDLGSAGHDGFLSTNDGEMHNIRYVRGSHSAALAEENWDAIAQFVVNGDRTPPPLLLRAQHPVIVAVGHIAPVIWLVIAALLALIGWSILDTNWPEWWKTTILIAYLYGIYKVLTKV